MTPQPADPKKTLLEQLKQPLQEAIDKHLDPETDPEKQAQYRIARLNDFHFRGIQNVAPTWVAGSTGFADYAPTTPQQPALPNVGAAGRFDYPFNFIRPDGVKIAAVAGRAPKISAVPDNPDDPDGDFTVEAVDVAREYLHEQWNIDQRQIDLFLLLYKNSTAFSYVQYVADGKKYGYTNVPQIAEMAEVIQEGGFHCDNCGTTTPGDLSATLSLCPVCSSDLLRFEEPQTIDVPQEIGQKSYENGSVDLRLASIFEVTVPFRTKNIEDAEWLLYEYDESKGRLLQVYPTLRDKLKENDSGATASRQLGTEVRRMAQSPTGILYKTLNLWRYSRYWLTTSTYELIESKTFRSILYQNFPDGLMVALVNGEVVELRPEKLADHWTACKPSISEYIYADPICTDSIPIQELYNDSYNLAAQTLFNAIPATIVSPDLLDRKAIESRPPVPNELIWAKPSAGTRMDDLMAKLPTATFPKELVGFQESVREASREFSGATRELAGIAGPTNTAEEARIRQNAALRQISVPYNNSRTFWVGTTEKAIRLLSKLGIGAIQTKAKPSFLGYEGRSIDLASLPANGWHLEADEGLPANHAEERDHIRDMAKNAPELVQQLGWAHPFNISKMNNYVGVKGFFVPGEQLKKKVQTIIRDLLVQPPIPAQPEIDPMTGQPMPPGPDQPTLQPDPFDDHAMVADLIAAWCVTPAGMKAQRENPQGFANVVARWNAEKQLALPPMPPGGPEGGPGPNGPPGPPNQALNEQPPMPEAPKPAGAPLPVQ